MSVKRKKLHKNTDERDSQVKSTESNVEEAADMPENAKDDWKEKESEKGKKINIEKKSKKTDDKQEMMKKVQQAEEQLDTLKFANAELQNDILRKQADFDNFRKRMQRDKQEAIKYANANLLQDIISIIDDFERAITSSEESRDFQSFHSGIKMIEHQFIGMLERKYGLKRMEAVGKEFDPQKHEAIGMEESPDVTTQMVIEDYQRGYVLNERVLRHAKVKVAMPVSDSVDGVKKPDPVSDMESSGFEGMTAEENRISSEENGTEQEKGQQEKE